MPEFQLRRLGNRYRDGIHLNFATGVHYVKGLGAAPRRDLLTNLFTFTGGNQSMYVGAGGLLVASATNTPRIEYDPITLGVRGLLMEAARTNLCLQSQDQATTWTTNNVTLSTNAVAAPDGTTTADKLVETTATGQHNTAQGITKAASSLTYTFSTFVKAAERTYVSLRLGSDTGGTNSFYCIFDLSAGTVGSNSSTGAGYTFASAGIQAYPSGWYRVWIVGSTDTGTTVAPMVHVKTDATTSLSYTGVATNGIYVWGTQVELGSFPSSYIPTTTGSVARTADVCTRTLGTEFSATAGTVVVQGRAGGGQDAAGGQNAYSIDDATGNNRFNLTRPVGSNTARFVVTNASVNQAVLDETWANLTAFKHAAAWAVNDFAESFNGAAAQTDTSGSLPTVTTLGLACLGSGLTAFNGHIKTFDYYPSRLPNTYLIAAST